MGVAITFCDKTKRQRCQNKHGHLSFRRSQAESLPRLIQFGVHPQFLAYCFCLKVHWAERGLPLCSVLTHYSLYGGRSRLHDAIYFQLDLCAYMRA